MNKEIRKKLNEYWVRYILTVRQNGNLHEGGRRLAFGSWNKNRRE